MAISKRMAAVSYRVTERMRVPSDKAIRAGNHGGTLDDLARGRYCTVVTFRRSGEPVATPVWYGTAGDRLYFRSLADAGKVKRIRGNPRVVVAPCTMRGVPTGAAMAGRARLLTPSEEAVAERAIRGRSGLTRLFYKRATRQAAAVYVEVVPDPA